MKKIYFVWYESGPGAMPGPHGNRDRIYARFRNKEKAIETRNRLNNAGILSWIERNPDR